MSSASSLIEGRPVVALLGDSITEDCGGGRHGGLERHNIGYWTWANIFLGQRFAYAQIHNFGVAGDRVADIAARVPQVIAARPDLCVVLAGSNDAFRTRAIEQAKKAYLRDIVRPLQAAGIEVVAVRIPPFRSKHREQHLRRVELNKWLGRVPDLLVVDPNSDMTDPVSGDPLPGVTRDDVHLNNAGAFLMGRALAKTLAERWPKPSGEENNLLRLEGRDLGLFEGVGGEISPGSGELAANWRLLGTGAGTAVAQKEPHPFGAAQRVQIEGEASGIERWVLQPLGGYPLTIGGADHVCARVEIEVKSSRGLMGIQLTLHEAKPGAPCAKDGGVVSWIPTELPPGEWTGVLETPPLPLTGAGVHFSIEIYFKPGAFELDASFTRASVHRVWSLPTPPAPLATAVEGGHKRKSISSRFRPSPSGAEDAIGLSIRSRLARHIPRMRRQQVDIWRTFMAITLFVAIVLGAATSALRIPTTAISETAFGTVLTLGNLIEMALAAVVGGVATALLRAKSRR